MNGRKFFESSIKGKIGKILMIIGALTILWPMYLFTGIALMAETEPPVNVIIFLLVGCLAGPLTILSVILSFLKSKARVGFIGSVFFSLPFLILGIWTAIPSTHGSLLELSFIEITGIVIIFLLLSIPSIFIILGTILRTI